MCLRVCVCGCEIAHARVFMPQTIARTLSEREKRRAFKAPSPRSSISFLVCTIHKHTFRPHTPTRTRRATSTISQATYGRPEEPYTHTNPTHPSNPSTITKPPFAFALHLLADKFLHRAEIVCPVTSRRHLTYELVHLYTILYLLYIYTILYMCAHKTRTHRAMEMHNGNASAYISYAA